MVTYTSKISKTAARGQRLRLARLAAGYDTVSEVAHRFRLSVATMEAHEEGRDRIPPFYLRRYADLLQVSLDWLEHGVGPDPIKRSLEMEPGWGARLTLARRVAGFLRGADAIKRYGFNANYYYVHEAGRSVFGRSYAALYGKAFSVSANWLRSGLEPSGLPPEIVQDLDRYLGLAAMKDADAREQLPVVDPTRAGPDRLVTALVPQTRRSVSKGEPDRAYRPDKVRQAILTMETVRGAIAGTHPEQAESLRAAVDELVGQGPANEEEPDLAPRGP